MPAASEGAEQAAAMVRDLREWCVGRARTTGRFRVSVSAPGPYRDHGGRPVPDRGTRTRSTTRRTRMHRAQVRPRCDVDVCPGFGECPSGGDGVLDRRIPANLYYAWRPEVPTFLPSIALCPPLSYGFTATVHTR